VRPTGDRVREAVFSSLESLGAVEGASVLDLFAGSGALGIEALSRGASNATFVDDDRAALESVTANLAATALGENATVVSEDALRFLARAAQFDLALVDPPYAFDAWPALLETLHAGVAVLESDREIEVGAGWRVLRTKGYGDTVVTLVLSTDRLSTD
jgi:16S rRNA (guanine966-N2)-methyltransferase